ncbi:GNAT family N-acetyltransferase [Stakelama marina]|uniref:GNAT family N-acetyltransferase n=1 Tax=Stakelama marina TaxID=2826939 RepID=A0A8T4IBI0_9SPHN|nr:GNAT family N-acetyltransferase [Stakelama marina]MBR0551184.1 GNAT family N-acetyltransferase [Stakelama marina]
MFMRTRRLTLRPGWAEDAPELAAAIGHQDVARMLGRMPWPYSLSDAESFLATEKREGAGFLICSREGDDAPIIGGIGFGPHDDRPHELGYWLTPAAWGNGYATEAGLAVIELARALGVPRLTAGHFVDNPASGKVLRKLGFQPIATHNRYSLGRDAWTPCAEYALQLRSEPDHGGDEQDARLAA